MQSATPHGATRSQAESLTCERGHDFDAAAGRALCPQLSDSLESTEELARERRRLRRVGWRAERGRRPGFGPAGKYQVGGLSAWMAARPAPPPRPSPRRTLPGVAPVVPTRVATQPSADLGRREPADASLVIARHVRSHLGGAKKLVGAVGSLS